MCKRNSGRINRQSTGYPRKSQPYKSNQYSHTTTQYFKWMLIPIAHCWCGNKSRHILLHYFII
ncbi:MAG: hypothetical protein ACJAVV_003795 [Alphaproteobacteria bacterium]